MAQAASEDLERRKGAMRNTELGQQNLEEAIWAQKENWELNQSLLEAPFHETLDGAGASGRQAQKSAAATPPQEWAEARHGFHKTDRRRRAFEAKELPAPDVNGAEVMDIDAEDTPRRPHAEGQSAMELERDAPRVKREREVSDVAKEPKKKRSAVTTSEIAPYSSDDSQSPSSKVFSMLGGNLNKGEMETWSLTREAHNDANGPLEFSELAFEIDGWIST